MTEKLTYDPTPADAPEFTEDEQDSLAVAEKLGQQESELYAGKVQKCRRTRRSIHQIYKKKLETSDDDDEVEDTYLDEDEYPEEVVEGVDLIQTASEEYFENDGQLSAETMERFTEMSSSELVEAYMAIRERNPDVDGGTSSPDLTDAEMNQVYNSAGGEAEYAKLTSWAAQNLSELS